MVLFWIRVVHSRRVHPPSRRALRYGSEPVTQADAIHGVARERLSARELEIGPGGIAQMLVHGLARSAFARIVLGLHEPELAASLVDNLVVIERVLFGDAIGNTQ